MLFTSRKKEMDIWISSRLIYFTLQRNLLLSQDLGH
jgi:hypothetical protein